MSAYHDGINWVEPEDRPLLLPPSALQLSGPTVTTVGGGRMGALNFPDGSLTTGLVTVPVPVGWSAAKVSILWTKGASGAAGEVARWLIQHAQFADGDGLNVADAALSNNAAAPAQDVLTATVMSSALAVTGGRLLRMRVQREGAAAADTLAGGAMFVFLRVERVR